MHDQYKEVDFKKYCSQCEYKEAPDTEEPCNECLEHPAIPYTSKPMNYKENN